MLSDRYSPAQVATALIQRPEWHPAPTATARDAWEALPARVREAQVRRGERHLDAGWPPLPATRFLDYVRDGDRSRFEALSFGRRNALTDLVLAECVEGHGRFVDAIVDGVWAICEETYWGVPAHVGVQRAGRGLPDIGEPTVDLFAAETASLLAWTLYLLGAGLDAVSPLLRARILTEARRRLLDPCLVRDDFHWMGLQRTHRVNNWNPWICSNWLTTALLLEEDEDWRAQHVHKAMRCLDEFVDPYPADGGCDEGPSYWGRAGASLFDCLDLLRSATAGAVDVFGEPLIGDIGRFVYRVHIADDWYTNFADAPASVRPDAALVFRNGQAIDDADMTALGAWLAQRQAPATRGVSGSIGRALRTLFSLEDLEAAVARAPLPRDAWLPVIEVMTARDAAGSTQGFFVAAKGGHNAESHNHNDIGTFVLCTDGAPVVVDAGVESYTAKTFSAERYDIWTMQSAYHNLPTIGTVQQQAGASFAARGATYAADEAAAELRLDLAGAYPEGALRRWERTIRLERGVALTVTDDFELEAAAPELSLSLITPCEVAADGATAVALTPRELAAGRSSGRADLACDFGDLDPELAVDVIDIDDERLRGIWGTRLVRLRWVVAAPPTRGRWTLRITAAT